MANLRAFLTELKTPDDRSLFKSGNDLATRIAAIEPSEMLGVNPTNPYFGRRISASSLINQVFRGERPCYEDLRLMIKEAIRLRLKDSNLSGDALNEWIAAFEEEASKTEEERKSRLGRNRNIQTPWDELLNCEAVAAEIFAINVSFYSGEGLLKHRLRKIMMRRLKLCVSPPRPDSGISPRTPVGTMCVDSELRGITYLRALFELSTQARGENPGGEPLAVEQALARLDALISADVLRIVNVGPLLSGIPVVAYDPNTENIKVFVPGYSASNVPNVYKLEGYMAQNWQNQTYGLLKHEESIAPRLWSQNRDNVARDVEKALLRKSVD